MERSEQWIRFLRRQVPIFIHAAAAKPEAFPFTCRGYGYRHESGPERIWLYLLKSQWLRLKSYIEHPKELTALLTSGTDNESYQFKGRLSDVRSLSKEDVSALEEQYRRTLEHAPALAPLVHVSASDCLAVELRIHSVYSQTPGPDAGSLATERSSVL